MQRVEVGCASAVRRERKVAFDVVTAVLIDVGGVLLLPDPDVRGTIARAHGGGADHETVTRAHYAAASAADDGTSFDWAAYRREVMARCGVRTDRLAAAAAELGVAERARNTWTHPVAGAKAALHALAAGRRVGIVSNSDGTVEATLRQLSIATVGVVGGVVGGVAVEVLVDSYVAGVAKPDPKIFRIALKAMDLAPEQVVYVGDMRFADVAGPRAAGIRPLHLDPYGDCPGRDDHDHVADLTEVARVVWGT